MYQSEFDSQFKTFQEEEFEELYSSTGSSLIRSSKRRVVSDTGMSNDEGDTRFTFPQHGSASILSPLGAKLLKF